MVLIIKITPVNTITTRPTRILAYSYVAAFIILVRLRAVLVDVYGAPVNMTPHDNYTLAVYADGDRCAVVYTCRQVLQQRADLQRQ